MYVFMKLFSKLLSSLIAGRREKVTRAHLTDTLGSINSSFQKHASCAVQKAQRTLRKVFGYDVIITPNDGYFITNTIRYVF